MTATNQDDRLGEIYPTEQNELNCTSLALVFQVVIAAAVMVMVCGRHDIGRGVARNLFWGYNFFLWEGGGIKLLNSRSDVIFTP